MKYRDLTIHQRINYKSGWDIAIAYESGTYNKMVKCVNADIPIQCCLQDYNSTQKHRFLNGGRTLLKH